MKKTEQPIYNRVLLYSNVCRITREADSFSLSPSEWRYGASAWPRLEVVKSSKTCGFSLFFVIRNAVPSSHIVISLANEDIVMLTLWTCIRKCWFWIKAGTSVLIEVLLSLASRQCWSSNSIGDDRFLRNPLQLIIHHSSNLWHCMVRNTILLW
jgi:hypothetical protein